MTIRNETRQCSSVTGGRRPASVRLQPGEEDVSFIHCWFRIEPVPAHHRFCHSCLKVFRFVTSCFNPWQETHVCRWRRERLVGGRVVAAEAAMTAIVLRWTTWSQAYHAPLMKAPHFDHHYTHN